ncbi:MAG: zinc ribbon domain-containing protein [Candidatus Pacearchaeota archaeon]
MPWYDFRCSNEECLHVFEIVSSIKDVEDMKVCPKCGSTAFRLVSAPTFKMWGEPPRDFKPLTRNQTKSHIEPIRRKKQ